MSVSIQVAIALVAIALILGGYLGYRFHDTATQVNESIVRLRARHLDNDA